MFKFSKVDHNKFKFSKLITTSIAKEVGGYLFRKLDTFTLDFVPYGDGTCYVAGTGNYEGPVITIPEESPEGDTVINISSAAFQHYDDKITTLYLPDTLQRVENEAFNCSCFSNLNYNVDGNGFYYLGSKTNEHLYLAKAENDVSILTTNQGSGTPINENTRIIGYKAFKTTADYTCKLTSIELENSNILSIGFCAFQYARQLETVSLPESLLELGQSAFEECSNLRTISFPSNSALKAINQDTFLRCYSLGNFDLPEGITEIGQGAFFKCTSLTEITIPNSVRYIRKHAFSSNNAIADVETHEDPMELTTFRLKSGSQLEVIDSDAFGNCTKLNKVYIPSFEKWVDITFLYDKTSCPIGTHDYDTTEFYINDSRFTGNIDITGANLNTRTYNTKDNVDTIECYPQISPGAFRKAKSITSVSLPSSITKIGQSAFYACSSMTAINTEDASIEIIGESAFDACSSLTSITTGAQLKNIYKNAFNSCSSLETINLFVSNITSLPQGIFQNCSAVTSISLPNSIVSMNSASMFAGCTNLNSINIPTSLRNLGTDIFNGCTGLYDYQRHNSYGTSIYLKDSNGQDRYLLCGIPDLDVLTIPDGVRFIGARAVYEDQYLTSVSIPSSVQIIDIAAFYDCYNNCNRTIVSCPLFLSFLPLVFR